MLTASHKDTRPNLELLARVTQNGTKFFLCSQLAQKIPSHITCFSMDLYWFTVRSHAVTVQKKSLPPPPVWYTA